MSNPTESGDITGMRRALVVGGCVTATVCATLPVLLTDSTSRSEYFWPRVAWTDVLVALLWISVWKTLPSRAASDSKDVRHGVAPALGLSVTAFCIVSFVLMMAHAFLPEGTFSGKAHLVGQVVSGAALLVTIALLAVNRASAVAPEQSQETATPPAVLVAKLQTVESMVSNASTTTLSEGLKRLREKVAYSLTRGGAIRAIDDYRRFALDVDRLCEEVLEKSSQVEELDPATFENRIKENLSLVDVIVAAERY